MEHKVNKSSGKPSVYIRLAPDLSVALDAASAEAGLSRAGWVRRVMVRALPTGSDFASLRPSPPRRPVVIPPDDLVEVSKLAGAVARNNGAVVQLVRAMRETGHASHQDAEAVLAALRETQGDLLRTVTGLKLRLDA